MSTNIVNFENNKTFDYYKRDVPVDINLIIAAWFIKNKKAAQSRSIKIKNQSIEINGGKYTDPITKVTHELTVPNEYDENILYSIVCQMLKFRDKYNLDIIPQTFICTYGDIIDNLKADKQRQDLIRTSLYKLRNTSYQLHDYFLTTEDGHLLTDDDAKEINKTKKIKRMSVTDTINILDAFAEYKLETLDITELSKETGHNAEHIESIIENAHGKTQYLLKIKLNDKFYNNLISKVYMLHSIEFLIGLPGIERAVYTFTYLNAGREIFKAKMHELENKLSMRVGLIDIAETIPLSIEEKRISISYLRILEALNYLNSNGYIKSFFADKTRPIRNSKFTIEFYEEQNRKNSKYSGFDVKKIKSLSQTESSHNEFFQNGALKNSEESQVNSEYVPTNKNVDNEETIEVITGKHKIFSELMESIQNSKNIGIINSGNRVALKALFENFIDHDVIVNDIVVSDSKGLLLIQAIKDWLENYKNAKNVNKLLSSCLRMESNPYYLSNYDYIVSNLYLKHIAEEKELREIQVKEKKQQEQNEKQKQAEMFFNSYYSEWQSNFHKLTLNEQDKYVIKAEKKLKLKNLSYTLEFLTIMILAIETVGAEEMCIILRKSNRQFDIFNLGLIY